MENDTVKNSDEHSVMPVISGISEPSCEVTREIQKKVQMD